MGIDKRFDELDCFFVDQSAEQETRVVQVDGIDMIAGSNTFYPDTTELDGYPPRARTTLDRLASMGLSGNIKVIRPEES